MGKEATESIIAAKNSDKAEISCEVSDLMFHLSVMLYDKGLSWDNVFEELSMRR